MSDYASDWQHPAYDEGGILPLGYTLVRNTTSAIEPIMLDPCQVDTVLDDKGHIIGYRYHPQRGDECPDSPASPDA
ncbi:hypothetical protein ACIOD2_32320 [Amycolatopsis sp. NPDC088138]|uniref:hypothetical protein n=1 Tax=Amycolatopsis sp. NPDC088138 TaxID=3363938 RepID=UPI00381B75E9